MARATPLHRYYHSPVGLPSCVTPSLAYYQSGSRASTRRSPRKVHGEHSGGQHRWVQHGRSFAGTGISTRCPSTTPVGLALGPGSPWADKPGPGTLGQSAAESLTLDSLLMPAFSLPHPPPQVHTEASPDAGRSPTQHTHVCVATASAVRLSPATLSAQDHLTSELLRTLSRMAASKPTSWLSGRPHILSHLAHA